MRRSGASRANCRTRWPAIRRSSRSCTNAGSGDPRRRARRQWSFGYFRADNRNDILFVTSEQTGFGYFKNFGGTRRQGIELGAKRRVGRVDVGGGYTLLDATYQSEEIVNGESNSTNDAAEDGEPGLEGTIEIEPGDRMPLIPAHMFKVYADVQVTRALALDVDLVARLGPVRARQREQPARAGRRLLPRPRRQRAATPWSIWARRYQLTPWLQIDRAGQQPVRSPTTPPPRNWPAGFTDGGTFIARPFPPVNGEFPLCHRHRA